MKDKLITFENDGIILQRTNYYDTPQAQRGEVYLSWNKDCARLLVPQSQRELVRKMKCGKVIVTKQKQGIHIMFDDGSDAPFRLVIAHEQNNRAITEGDCLFSVYVKLGEKYQFPCKCIVEHGNKGNANAKKGQGYDSKMNIEVRGKWRFTKQAQRDGMNLTAWTNKTLEAAIDDDLRDSAG